MSVKWQETSAGTHILWGEYIHALGPARCLGLVRETKAFVACTDGVPPLEKLFRTPEDAKAWLEARAVLLQKE